MKIKKHNLTILELPFLLFYAVLLAVLAGICLLGKAAIKSVLLSYKALRYTLKAKLLRIHLIGLGYVWLLKIV